MGDLGKNSNQKVFFTADTHIGSRNIIQHCSRPFSSVEEMDEALITNWNNTVTSKDIIFMLGDMVWGHQNYASVMSKLNGQKHLILGNHDNKQVYKKLMIDKIICSINCCKGITINNNYIWLSHYCHRTWNGSFHGSFHIFGHSHSRIQPTNKSMDVGVDNCNFKPISWEEVYEILKDRTNKD